MAQVLRIAGVVVATTALLGGCQASEPSAEPTTVPTSPSYDAEERALSREALRRLEEFEAANQPILAEGRATRQAGRLYRHWLREWQPAFAELEGYERQGIRFAHQIDVLSTRVVSIASFQDNAAEVVLERCVDESRVGMTRDGTPVPVVGGRPVFQEVVVHRYENRTWRIGTVTTTDRPCAG